MIRRTPNVKHIYSNTLKYMGMWTLHVKSINLMFPRTICRGNSLNLKGDEMKNNNTQWEQFILFTTSWWDYIN
jgi:hypothetical protein